mmetsp:Transcript_6935/g.15806  ORF Transcript_6935/g.15806 Transcript_6935/m.15806 type:complete len:521 (+) Transcript_6935:55-1617(+)
MVFVDGAPLTGEYDHLLRYYVWQRLPNATEFKVPSEPASPMQKPQPRRLLLLVNNPQVLNRRFRKSKDAWITIPELADEASPLPWGWTIAGQDRFREMNCSVQDLIRDAALNLETGVPPWMRDNPQIKAQIERVRALIDRVHDGGHFTVVIHERRSWRSIAVEHEEDNPVDEGSALESCFERGAGAVEEVFGDPGEKPKELPSLDVSGLAHFINSGACRSIVVLSGAGLSTASGIPDYRGSGGLWKTVHDMKLTATEAERTRILAEPEWVASIELFRQNPLPFLELKRGFVQGLHRREWRPTLGHFFIKLLHDKGLLTRVLTQNVDGLHQESGLPDEVITEVHGSLRSAECTVCGRQADLGELSNLLQTHVKDLSGRSPSAPSASRPGGLPCGGPGCDGTVRPRVVLFGEDLNPRFKEVFRDELPKADLLLVVGTSLAVAPAGTAPEHASAKCVRVLVNRERVGENAGLVFDAPAAQRDILLAGSIDEQFFTLAKLLGWEEALTDYAERMAPASAALLQR